MSEHQDFYFKFTLSSFEDDDFRVTEFEGTEAFSESAVFEVEVVSPLASIEEEVLIGKIATLTCFVDDAVEKTWHGFVTEALKAESLFDEGNDEGREEQDTADRSLYLIRFESVTHRLKLRQNCRVFMDKTLEEIVFTILKEMHFIDYEFLLFNPSSLPKREYCIQYRETDFQFIKRICAEEGIYFFDQQEQEKSTVIFTNNTCTARRLATPRIFNSDPNNNLEEFCVHDFRRKERFTFQKAVLKDYTFKNPPQPKKFDFTQRDRRLWDGYEHFDVPGRYKDDEIGQRFARHRINSLRRDAFTVLGKSNIPELAVGHVFTLSEHPLEDNNQNWHLSEVRHFGQQKTTLGASNTEQGSFYHNEFSGLEQHRPWAPPHEAKPVMHGVMVGTVVGSAGEEIFCDEQGRVHVKFHWDRNGPEDSDASCPIRVSQSWAGAGYGMMAIPRVGHEVIVSFLDGDPDQPRIPKPPADTLFSEMAQLEDKKMLCRHSHLC